MTDAVTPAVDELTELKAQADALGLSYHPSIGVEKLRQKLEEFQADAEEEAPETAEVANTSPSQPKPHETEQAFRARKKKEALQLVRVNITCMNPNKREWEGEFFTAGNSIVGTVTKYVPFNTEDGWHVPRILLNQIRERKFQTFYTVKDDKGRGVRRGKLVPEFAIEELPPLTEQELKELARKQAMRKSSE